MITFEQAQSLIQKQDRLDPVRLPVNEACRHVSAEDIFSKVCIPPFNNSAMDGFALVSDDVGFASDDNPVRLQVAGSTAAGDKPLTGKPGAWEIMTGACLPEGYDAVVKIEDVKIVDATADGQPSEIIISKPVEKNANIRLAGEDYQVNDQIIACGTVITPFHLMSLISIGQVSISVFPKTTITVLSTGKELVEDAGTPLLPGQIRNSNGPYLMSVLKQMQVDAHYGGLIADQPGVFEDKVKQALQSSGIIISTGAVSAGRHDFIPGSLAKLGAKILFHKVAIRPGKPILYAHLPNNTHYFGLPGNPVSAAIGLRFFVIPLIRRLQGLEGESALTTKLIKPYLKKRKLRYFLKAHTYVSKHGVLNTKLLSGQESFKVSTLRGTNCWATISENQSGQLQENQEINIYPLLPGGLLSI